MYNGIHMMFVVTFCVLKVYLKKKYNFETFALQEATKNTNSNVSLYNQEPQKASNGLKVQLPGNKLEKCGNKQKILGISCSFIEPYKVPFVRS